MENYEQKCLELDIELAGLLDYKDVSESKFSAFRLRGTIKNDSFTFERWTQDDTEAFRLMVEYNVELEMFDNFVADFRTGPNYYHKDFPDKQSAVRYAIVQAVIDKLKVANG